MIRLYKLPRYAFVCVIDTRKMKIRLIKKSRRESIQILKYSKVWYIMHIVPVSHDFELDRPHITSALTVSSSGVLDFIINCFPLFLL